ncbi:MAG: diacylglycerol/lipid kinase family protein [Bacteroidaceae bacterium]
MDAKKRIVFIVNPISGTQNKRAILALLDKRMDHSRHECRTLRTEYAGHATLLARQAADEGADMVVAIGGDGTVNEIARSLVHTPTALGIIPCGSGNGLARHLQIPMEARGAIDTINEGHTRCIDYGRVNGIPFFCTCGVGFDAFVSLKFAESGKRGLLTYLENTLHESLKYKPETYEIENEDGTMRHKAFLIACANASQYGNNAYIAPGASLSDGLMDVTILEPFTVLDVPALAFQLFNKTLDQNSRIKTFKSKRITIHRSQPGVIHFDGDPAEAGCTIGVEIVGQGLNVCTPLPKPKADGLRPVAVGLKQLGELLEGLTEPGRNLLEESKSLIRRLKDKE